MALTNDQKLQFGDTVVKSSVQTLASKHNLRFYQTSAKIGDNVIKVFEDLANIIHEKLNKIELENNMKSPRPGDDKL